MFYQQFCYPHIKYEYKVIFLLLLFTNVKISKGKATLPLVALSESNFVGIGLCVE